MKRVVHFEIQVDDTERAVKFYSEVFDWKIEKWPGFDGEYWIIYTAPMGSDIPGISGGMFKRTTPIPAVDSSVNAYICVIDVDNFDEYAQKIIAAGGKQSTPKSAIPGMAWTGYFIDTENNTFGLFQEDKDAE